MNRKQFRVFSFIYWGALAVLAFVALAVMPATKCEGFSAPFCERALIQTLFSAVFD